MREAVRSRRGKGLLAFGTATAALTGAVLAADGEEPKMQNAAMSHSVPEKPAAGGNLTIAPSTSTK